MAMQVGLSGQVVAFEPDPVAFARLELHVRKNDLSNVVSILAAVSSSSDSVELISVGGLGSTLSHLRYPDEPVAQAEVTLEVKSVVPDALVASGPTGVAVIIQTDGEEDLEKVKGEVERVSKKLGRTLTYVVGKPGLDGHSNGSEQIAARARQAGMNVIYEGIRFTPEEIVQQAIDSKAHVVGLSILSGSHLDLVKDTLGVLRAKGLNIPVVVGGIIPEADALALKQMGVRRVYTPKDYKITQIMGDVVKVVEETLTTAE